MSLQGPSPAGDAAADAQEWSLEQLAEAAADTHFDSLAVAEIESAFLEGEQHRGPDVSCPCGIGGGGRRSLLAACWDACWLACSTHAWRAPPPCMFTRVRPRRAGTADEDTSGYLSSLRAEADALLTSGRGRGAEAATAQVAAAAAELLEAGDGEAPAARARSMSPATCMHCTPPWKLLPLASC